MSHTIEDGLITYKGLPAPIICDFLSREASKAFYEDGTEFQIGKIELVSNTGTYVDCPFHRFEDGKDLADTELDKFVDLAAVCIRVPHTETLKITKTYFEGFDLENKAVLIATGWDAHWNTEHYFENSPYVTKEAAEFLRDSNVALVGIDSQNVDDVTSTSRPVHTILLKEEILIAEHLCNLGNLPQKGFTFSAVPPKFKGVGTFPVRAYAKLA